MFKGFPGGSESICNTCDVGLIPGSGRIPQRKKWQLLPGKFHGQRSLVSYSPWGSKRVGHNLATKQQHVKGASTASTLDLRQIEFIVMPGKGDYLKTVDCPH